MRSRGMDPASMGPDRPKPKERRATLVRISRLLGRRPGLLALVACLVVASTLLSLLGPYLLGRAIDQCIARRDMGALASTCLAMGAVFLTSSALSWLQGYIMAGVAQEAIFELRRDLLAALQKLPLPYFDSRPDGDLMSRLTNDVERLSSVLTDSLAQIVSGLLGIVGIVAAMMFLSPVLTLVTLAATLGMSLFFNRVIARRIGAGFRRQQSALGSLNGLVQESISGSRVVKAYAQEPAWLARFDSSNTDLRDAGTSAQGFAGMTGPLMNGSGNLALALVAGTGGWLVVQGLTTVGTVAAFINYSRQIARPLNDFGNVIGSIESALAGAERAFEIIDAEPEPDSDSLVSPEDFEGDVRFEEVDFSYEPGEPILRGISLHARRGERAALVGPTGAGKTTIVNLLTRFYEIDRGRILIDGRDVREIPKKILRRMVGIVLQDTYLFTGTVRENIRYGRLDASDKEVAEAACLANADAFIRHLPHGYDTHVLEGGANLSQGQRQLLSIARTVLANPRILILDEATSSVDTLTERHIQEAMLRLMEGRTCLVIAHRLSTIRTADQILVLRGGEIIERGSHAELVAAKGLYYSMVSSLASAVEDEE